jgi:hypothetical protein
VVGYHWFEHADQPAEGRFDGENSNFGTVTIEDNVYAELTEAMTRLNAAAEQIHAKAAHSLAAGAEEPGAVKPRSSPDWLRPREPRPWCETRLRD